MPDPTTSTSDSSPRFTERDEAAFEPGTVPRDVEVDVLCVVVCTWCGDVEKVDTEAAAYEAAEAHRKAHEDASD